MLCSLQVPDGEGMQTRRLVAKQMNNF